MSGGPLVVVGDALLDRDVEGTVERVSPDAPVPVLEASAVVTRPGGAALAALMGASEGRRTILVTATGGDAGRELTALLRAAGVEVVDLGLGGPTPEKIRLRSSGHPLLRVDRGGRPAPVGRWSPEASAAIAAAGAILVSDYGRGVTTIGALREALAAAHAPVVWDPHPCGAPPVPGARAVTPNRTELLAADRLAVGAAPAIAATASGGPSLPQSPSGAAGPGPDGASPTSLRALTAAGRRAQARWASTSVVVTLGAGGCLLVAGDAPPLAVPAVAVRGGDPCGAGDRFAVTLAAALGDGAILTDAAVAATAAATAHVVTMSAPEAGSPVVERIGAAPRDEVVRLVQRARDAGRTVAVAGGCFDVLHAGHMALLAAASGVADVLVVAINSDRSVRRLKGAGRPVVPETDRLAVLAAIGAVHAVTVFDEATPSSILEQLRPDVFVKGGDYAHAPLAEEALVARWGGQAVVVPYLDGRSTTGLLRAAATAP